MISVRTNAIFVVFFVVGISHLISYSQNDFLKTEKNKYSDNYYLNLGILAAENKKSDSAIYYISKSIELNNKNPITYYVRATVLYELNRYDEAIADLNQSIKINPNDEKALYLRAIINQNRLDFINAIKDYEKLIKMNPKDTNYRFQYAYCLQEINEFQKSIDAYLNYEKLVTKPSQEFFINVAYNYVKLKQYSEALKYILKSEKQGYNISELVELKINILISQQNCEQAIKIFEDNKNSLENQSILLTNIGSCYLKIKEYNKAIQALAKAYEIDNSLVENLFYLAYIQQQLGNRKATQSYLEQFVDQSKNRDDLINLREDAIKQLEFIKKNK